MKCQEDHVCGAFKEILSLAWPIVISTSSSTVMQFCNRLFLAWHSLLAIQAILPAHALTFTITCGFLGIAEYTNVFVAQYYGRNDYIGCRRSTIQGLYISLLTYPVLFLFIPVFSFIFNLCGHSPEITSAEKIYTTLLIIGSLPVMISAVLSSFFTGQGNALVPMYANILGNVVNIFFSYILIFGKLGFPNLGIKGAAIANMIGSSTICAYLFIIYFAKKNNIKFKTRSCFKIEYNLILKMLRFGVPSGLHFSLEIGCFAVFVLLIGRLGSIELAASNIALSINMLAFFPLFGIGIATSTLVGQYQGMENPKIAEKIGWSAIKIGVAYTLFTGLIFIGASHLLLSIFAGHDLNSITIEELYPIGKYLLFIMAIWGLADASQLILSFALKGAGDTRFVMLFSSSIGWIFFVFGEIVLIVVFKCSIYLAWMMIVLWVSILFIGYAIRFYKGTWKKIDLISPIEQKSSNLINNKLTNSELIIIESD